MVQYLTAGSDCSPGGDCPKPLFDLTFPAWFGFLVFLVLLLTVAMIGLVVRRLVRGARPSRRSAGHETIPSADVPYGGLRDEPEATARPTADRVAPGPTVSRGRGG